MLKALRIADEHPDLFTYIAGDLQRDAVRCQPPDEATSESLVYASEPAQIQQALSRNVAILIVHRKLAGVLGGLLTGSPGDSTGEAPGGLLAVAPAASQSAATCCFSTPGIPLAMAILLRYFDVKAQRFTQWGERHPTAVVHATAAVSANVVLGPYCVIGAGAVVGENCLIGAHTVIENGARIGAGTILHPHVFVGAGCEVGNRCEIHPHSSVGSDGFGYATDPSGKPRKIPQLGNVRIGDDVEIGSSCAIDRATLTATYIRSGTKLDNLCHIAHNCDLGENGFFTAGFMMAGSTKIGRNFRTGGNSVVSAHLTVADDVVLAGRSSVTNDITAPGQYGGFPLQPLHDALKTLVNIGRLNRIRKDLNRVMKHLRLRAEDAETV